MTQRSFFSTKPSRKTLRPGEKRISSALFLVTITESLRKTGITNLQFSVLETQRGPWPHEQSPYPAPAAEHWFPVAWTHAEMKRSLDRKLSLLEQLQPPGEQHQWIPDYVTVDHLRLRQGIPLSETTYMMVDDSLRWSMLFEQEISQDNNWRFVMTEEDFRHYFAIVIARRDPGFELGIKDIFWTEQGLRIDTSVKTNPDQEEPDLLVILMPRGDYGVMSFRGKWKIHRSREPAITPYLTSSTKAYKSGFPGLLLMASCLIVPVAPPGFHK